MKKIIAAALSILVGTFGFTIVDKELIERVDNLEYSVSSMQEQIDQMEPSTYETTKCDVITSKPNTTKPNTTQDTHPLEVGDEIPLSKDQMKKFLVSEGLSEFYCSEYYYIETGESPYQWTTTRHTNTSKPEEKNKCFIYIDNVTAKVSNIYDETSSYYNSDYTVCTKVYKKYTLDVCIKGHTSEKLSGYNIEFLRFKLSNASFQAKTTTDIINSDGLFEINLSIDSLGLDNSTKLLFGYPSVFR